MDSKYTAYLRKNRRGQWYLVIRENQSRKIIVKSSESYHIASECVQFARDLGIPLDGDGAGEEPGQ
jgi:hypothetical protein